LKQKAAHDSATRSGTNGHNSRWRSVVFACAIAFPISASFAWAAMGTPLPLLLGAAVFLFFAVERDLQERKIPNGLTLPALLGAIALRTFLAGGAGAQAALIGAGAAFAVLFIPFALRWLGAGDVKAVMVLGALWGHEVLLPSLWWMIAIGGVLALLFVALRGDLPDLLTRWWLTLRTSLATRRLTYFAPAKTSAAAGGLPFAVAMGLGATAQQLWRAPWF